MHDGVIMTDCQIPADALSCIQQHFDNNLIMTLAVHPALYAGTRFSLLVEDYYQNPCCIKTSCCIYRHINNGLINIWVGNHRRGK